MTRLLLTAAAIGLLAGAAQAQPPEARATVCVDVNGGLLAAQCRAPASRVEAQEEICLCPRGKRVEASLCPQGVSPPAESLAVARARNQHLRLHRDLVGASLHGKPLCVARPPG